MVVCFFQAPGIHGNQSLCRESQPFLLFLSDSSFVVASFGSSNWSLAIKCLHVEQQGPRCYVEGSTSCFCLEMSCASFRDRYTSS